MRKALSLITVLLAAVGMASAQVSRIDAVNEPLDRVITKLGVEVSFDSRALSSYNVTLKKTFGNPKQAIDHLLRGKPFVCEEIDGVFVIYPKPLPDNPEKEYYSFACTLTDGENGEKLPYGYVKTSLGMALTDNNGYFSFRTGSDAPVSVNIQYLGYAPVDTTLAVGAHRLYISPRPVAISKVVVGNSPAGMMMQSGGRSGESRVNHNVARYMPGSGDNSVFNLLRMMPGVRASGEPSEELIVWGSSGGESRIVFDGFTLYGMRGFNDNISFVNPYMVKDIRLMKGGYDVSYGNRAGAVAEISGMDGRTSKPSLKANVSALTANIYGSVPVTGRSALSVAYRQTFYNLYESDLLNPYNGRPGSSPGNGKGQGHGPGSGQSAAADTETYIFPDYAFRDLNLKYSGEAARNDKFHISLYGADDRFDFSVKQDEDSETDASQKSRQYAGAARYDRVWNNGSSTKATVLFSQFATDEKHVSVSRSQSNPVTVYDVDNRAREFSAKLEHRLDLGKRNSLKIGGELAHYTCRLNGVSDDLTIPSVYISDGFTYGKFMLDGGLRADLVSGKVRLQPRVSMRYQLTGNLNITASWGIYEQHIARIPVGAPGHLAFAWQTVKPVSATHAAAGLAYSRNGFLASAEGYNRRTGDVLRIFESGVEMTNVDIWGADVFLKKDFRKVTLFGSYSFTKTDKPLPEPGHEIKAGTIVTLSPFILSANYVYGTGFATLRIGGAGQSQGQGQGQGGQQAGSISDHTYSRLDIAAAYRKKFGGWTLQAGVSLMNVFDSDNIKYSYSVNTKNDPVTLYTKALPRTPMIYAEVLF